MLKLKEEIKQENETAHNQSDHPVGENEGVVKAERNNPVLSDGYLDSFNYASTECGAKILASSEKSQARSPPLSNNSLPLNSLSWQAPFFLL